MRQYYVNLLSFYFFISNIDKIGTPKLVKIAEWLNEYSQSEDFYDAIFTHKMSRFPEIIQEKFGINSLICANDIFSSCNWEDIADHYIEAFGRVCWSVQEQEERAKAIAYKSFFICEDGKDDVVYANYFDSICEYAESIGDSLDHVCDLPHDEMRPYWMRSEDEPEWLITDFAKRLKLIYKNVIDS